VTPDESPRPLSARAAATRQRILDAAVAEFAQNGLAGARVNEIAARSGANKRMLYEHFGSKEDLWIEVLERAHGARRAEEHALDVEHLPPGQALALLVRFNLRYTAAHPEFLALLHQENFHRAAQLRRGMAVPAGYSPLLASLRAVLKRGIDAGAFRADVDPQQLYATVLGLGDFWVANRLALSAIFGADLGTEAALEARERHVVEVVLGYLRP
jgi:AcrR family transcriptional regulator